MMTRSIIFLFLICVSRVNADALSLSIEEVPGDLGSVFVVLKNTSDVDDLYVIDKAVRGRGGVFPVGAMYSFIFFFPYAEDDRVVEGESGVSESYDAVKPTSYIEIPPCGIIKYKYTICDYGSHIYERIYSEKNTLFWSIDIAWGVKNDVGAIVIDVANFSGAKRINPQANR